MKTILKAFGTFIGVMFLFYLLGSFSQANLNLSQWTEGAREVTTMLGGMIAIMATAGMVIADIDKTDSL